jgi:hypothetical protein
MLTQLTARGNIAPPQCCPTACAYQPKPPKVVRLAERVPIAILCVDGEKLVRDGHIAVLH